MIKTYKNNRMLKAANVPIQFTKEQVLEYQKCMNDPVYFINKYTKIVNLDKGLMTFSLRDYQKTLISTIHNNRYTICKMSRQVGKSVTCGAYAAHLANFTPNQTIGILAHKGEMAKKFLADIKRMFEYIPNWLQQGVVEWNKTSVEFENGSRIFAAATSPAAVRGQSINMLILDEYAFVQPNTADEFYTSVFPTLSSSETAKIVVISCVTKDTMVLTPKGICTVESFVDTNQPDDPKHGYVVSPYSVQGANKLNTGNVMVNSGKSKTKIITSTHSELECSLNHKLWACKNGQYDWYKAEDLEVGDYVSVNYGMNVWGDDDSIHYTHISSNKEHNRFIPPSRMNEDLAYFLGLFLAEGCARECKNSRKEVIGGQIIISCGDDISYILNKLGVNWSKKDDVHYCINSISLLRFIQSMGFDITKKAKHKTIPDKILSMSRKNICAFVSGFFDGDGCVNSTRSRISVVSTSRILINQLRMILLNLGILSSLYTVITPPTKKVKVESTAHTLHISAEFSKLFITEIGFRLPRKHALCDLERFKAKRPYHKEDIVPFVRKLFNEDGIRYPSGMHRNTIHMNRHRCLNEIQIPDSYDKIIHPNIRWNKITKIQDSENEVFDFSLDNPNNNEWNHSVLYNGIIGHQTPKGLNQFYKLWTDAKEKRNLYVPVEVTWRDVPGRDERWKEEQIRNTSQEQFDQEHECLFLGSNNTLIAGPVLRQLTYRQPIKETNDGLKIYEDPKENHTYAMTVDVSRGSGIDYSAFTLIDITEAPYKVVATFKNNTMPPLVFPDIIYRVASGYNNAWVLVEVNDIGGQVSDILYDTMEYENLIRVSNRGRKGQVADSGFGGAKTTTGVKTTKTVKRSGCAILKTMIEDRKLIAEDYDIIYELSNFIAKNGSYEADIGMHDDLVMCLVLFSWLSTQPLFKELTDSDTRQVLYESHMKQIEEELTPFGFINTGNDEEESFVDDEGTRWEVSNPQEEGFNFFL